MPRGEGHIQRPEEDIESQFDLFPNTPKEPLQEKDAVGIKLDPEPIIKKRGFSSKSFNLKRTLVTFLAGLGIYGQAKLMTRANENSPDEIAAKIAEAKEITTNAEKAAELRYQLADDAETNDTLISPEWSTNPEDLQAQTTALLTNSEHQIDSEIGNKLDLAALMIAKLQAEKIITPEEATELKTIIEQKRAHFLKLAKTEPLSRVLHEIIQEHEHYNPAIVDLKSFVKDNTGNCRAAALGFLAYAESLKTYYPGLELKFQNFGGAVPHVRLIIKTEGQWFAIEKPTLTPITLEPGTVLEDVSVLALRITDPDAEVPSSLIPGIVDEGPEISAETQAELNELEDETIDPFLIPAVTKNSAKPTASYGDGSTPSVKEQPRIPYEQAQANLTNTNPVAKLITAELDQQIAKNVAEKIKNKTYKEIHKKVFAIQSFIKSSGKDATPKQEEELMALFTEAETAGLLEKLTTDLNTWNAILKDHDGLVSTGMEPLKLDTIAQKTLDILERYTNGPDEDLGLLMSPEQKKKFLRDKIHSLETNAGYSFNDENSNDLGIKLTTDELNQLSAAAQAGWREVQKFNGDRAVHSLIDLAFKHTVLPTINQPWFTELPIGEPGRLSLTFRSHDRDLNALKRFNNNEHLDRLDVDAPLEDFSGINQLVVNSPIFRNISPQARLETLNYQVENQAAAAPKFFNPPPEISFTALQSKFKDNFDVELDAVGTSVIDRRDISQFKECRNFNVDADFVAVDLSKLNGNKNLAMLTIKNPNLPIQNFEFLQSIQNSLNIIFEFTDEKNKDTSYNFATFADFLAFSKTYPNQSFTIPCKQSWEIHSFDDGRDLGLADEVTVENGKIAGAEKEKPQGEYANRVGALIEKLFKPGLRQNPREDVKNAMLEIPGSELPSIIAYLASQPLSAEEKQIFAEAVIVAKEALAEKQKFQDYKRFILNHDDQVGIGTTYFKPGDGYTTYKFNPSEENLREITEDIIVQNKKRKAHDQKPREITVFEPSTRLTAASEIWFNRLPLAKTMNNFELNTSNDALEFVVEKLRGKRIEVIKVIDNDQTSLFKSFNDLQFITLVIKDLKNQQKLQGLSPEVQANTIVDYVNTPEAMDKESITALSKLFPKITFIINNPDYDMDSSPNNLNGQQELMIINGEIQNFKY